MSKPYINNFLDFLIEQDMGGTVPGLSDGASPAKKQERYRFIFINDSTDDGVNKKKYPDGSLSVTYPSYSVTDSDIDSWTKENINSTDKIEMNKSIIDLRRKNIIDIVKGDKVNIADDDIPFIQMLKRATSTGVFGKKEPDVIVSFTKKGTPTTENIDTTFIKYRE